MMAGLILRVIRAHNQMLMHYWDGRSNCLQSCTVCPIYLLAESMLWRSFGGSSGSAEPSVRASDAAKLRPVFVL